MTLTASVIGRGRMGEEHVAAYNQLGIEIAEDGDIASIATPDADHFIQAATLLSAGKHVFVEKPLCREAIQLDAILMNQGLSHIGQNFPLRHNKEFQHKAAMLKYGKLGTVYRVEASYNWGRSWKLNEGWRARDPGYSLVLGGMIHMLDIVLWMGIDFQPISVIGTNLSTGFHNHDTVTALCRLENGGVASFTVDGGTGVKYHSHFLRIHGSKRVACVENYKSTDKRASIREFVKNIKHGTPDNDFRQTERAIQIEKMLHGDAR